MRRRTTIVGALALAAGVIGTGTSAASASGSWGATHPSVTGSAVAGFPTAAGPDTDRLSVWASSGPGGRHPSGTVRANAGPIAPFHVAGPVTCLLVDGNKAAIKYRFTAADGSAAAFKGGGVEVFIEDNGKPSNGHPVDFNAFNPPMTAVAFDAANPNRCDNPNVAPYQPVRAGDYTVHDG